MLRAVLLFATLSGAMPEERDIQKRAMFLLIFPCPYAALCAPATAAQQSPALYVVFPFRERARRAARGAFC